MDFAMREWLTVIIVLLIAAVLLDGWRRMRQSRRDSIKMSRRMPRGDDSDPLESYGSELPNGGARVIGTRDDNQTGELTKSLKKSSFQKRATSSYQSRIPEQVALNLDEEVPMLMESVTDEFNSAEGYVSSEDYMSSDDYVTADGRTEPSLGDFDEDVDDVSESEFRSERNPKPEPTKEKAQVNIESPKKYSPKSYTEEPKPAETWAQPDEVIVFNVMAREGNRLIGEELLEVLLASGMRFGDMDIFHRHLETNGEGPILFSMANMIKPGTFDLDTMQDFTTPGVSLFLTLPIKSDSLAAFEIMVRVAKALTQRLGADLKDENRSVMTSQTIEHCRQRVIEYERKRLSRAHA